MSSLAMPLPQSLQEMILARLPLEDLLRSRAVCKFWERITTGGSFLQRYGAGIRCSSPWHLILHCLPGGFITGRDAATDKPRGFSGQPWIPTSAKNPIVSTSGGLLLILDKSQESQARFSVVNPLTNITRELPPLELEPNQLIVYSQILCDSGDDDCSYKVVTMGVKNADTVNKLMYVLLFSLGLPDDTSKSTPFMLVYSSASPGSWTALPDDTFPPEARFPYACLCNAHQSLADPNTGIIYAITNTAEPHSHANMIARFSTRQMEWLPGLIRIPRNVRIKCMMIDREVGEFRVVVCDAEQRLTVGSIDEEIGYVVRRSENLEGMDLNEGGSCPVSEQVWGFGDELFVLSPAVDDDGEMGMACRCFSFRSGECSGSGGEMIPMNLYLTPGLELLKMEYFPSLWAP